jgi:hypothetical protein
VTRQDDPNWSSFVYWIVEATFYAEENGIDRLSSNEMPTVALFGEAFTRMFRDAISFVGSYGELPKNPSLTSCSSGRLWAFGISI